MPGERQPGLDGPTHRDPLQDVHTLFGNIQLSGKSRKIFHATTCMPFSPPLSVQSGGQAKEPAVCLRGGVPAAAQDGGGIIHFIAFGLDLTGAHLIWSCPLPF